MKKPGPAEIVYLSLLRIIVLSAWFLARVAVASPGDVDLTFGNYGKTVVQFRYQAYANGITLQRDGKILLFGSCNYGDYIDRLNPDGSLDPTFGSGGMMFNQNYATCSALAIASDQKLIAAGYYHTISRDYFSIRRYATNGVLDTTFGNAGMVIDMGFGGSASDVLIQPDGKIVLAGTGAPGTTQVFAMARFMSNGDLDTTFASAGRQFINFGKRSQNCSSIALQSDGKLIFAGYSQNDANDSQVIIVRCLPNGQLDPTFNTTGYVASSWGYSCQAFKVLIQRDGKILVSGWANLACLIARYNSDGSPDLSFGPTGNGVAATSVGYWDSWHSTILQPDSKIVAVGHTATYHSLVIARFKTNGVLDTTFGANGIVLNSLGTLDSTGIGLALQSDGKLLATGTQTDGNVHLGVRTNSLAVVRFNNDAALPPTISCSVPAVIDCAQALIAGALVNNPGTVDCAAIWILNGLAVQTNMIAPADGPVVPLSFSSQTVVGTNLLTVIVSDGRGFADSCSKQVLAIDASFPALIGVPANVIAGCDSIPAAANVIATDNCDPNPTVTFLEQVLPGKCSNQFTIVRTWASTDSSGNSSSAQQTVGVFDSTPPAFSSVPADVTASCNSVPTAVIPTVTDNCDSYPILLLSESSTQSSSGRSHDNYTITRTWTATDACGNSSTARQIINVADTAAPVVQHISATPASIWPPNDRLVPVRIFADAIDNCSTVSPKIVSISCNEPSTEQDRQITGDLTALLRARRLGKGFGRNYTLMVRCSDVTGNTTTTSVLVHVDHDEAVALTAQ